MDLVQAHILLLLLEHRGDILEIYKLFSGKYDDTVTSWLTGRHGESNYDLRNQ